MTPRRIRNLPRTANAFIKGWSYAIFQSRHTSRVISKLTEYDTLYPDAGDIVRITRGIDFVMSGESVMFLGRQGIPT